MLTALPESFGNLKSLEQLFFSWNQLTTLPESFIAPSPVLRYCPMSLQLKGNSRRFIQSSSIRAKAGMVPVILESRLPLTRAINLALISLRSRLGHAPLALFDLDDIFAPVASALSTDMMWQDGFVTLGAERWTRHFHVVVGPSHVSS